MPIQILKNSFKSFHGMLLAFRFGYNSDGSHAVGEEMYG